MFLLAAGLACLLCFPAAAQPAPASAQVAPVEVAPLRWRHRTLSNGLEIYAIRDTRSPNVAVQVWYRVGSKDDPAGRSGFAHLFEHMMFKATRDMPSEYFDRITEDVGGENNASTNDDYTEYHEVAPANYLQTLLWAEAERMGALVVDQAAFNSERDVVKEELRQRILAQPYGKLFGIYFAELSFDRSPYGRPGIGSISDLDAATLADVQAFHATYYRPDNAVMVVAGDFNDAELDGWIDQYFAPLQRPLGPIPRVSVTEPLRAAQKSWTVWEPNTPLPAVLFSYPLPPASSPDLPALIVADAILSKGDSSRLHQSLVYEQQIATQALSDLEQRAQPGAYAIAAIMAEGKSADQGEAALSEQIARLRDQPVGADELARAKNQLITDTLQQRATDEGQAGELENAIVLYGDAERANRLVADIQRVGAEDVQRVARRYLADGQRAVLKYLPDDNKPANAPVYGPAETIIARPLTRPADLKVVVAASPADRVAPPKPGAPVAVKEPQIAERTLANGLRVIVSPRHDVPLVTAELVLPTGAAADPQGLAGTASMTATLSTKGTRSRSATQIARAIESLGGSLSTSSSYDASTLTATVKTDALEPAMAVVADVARAPVFATDELDRARRQQQSDLDVALKDPAALAGWASARAVYGDAPYGRPEGGSPASLARLTSTQLAQFHARAWRPDGATLVFSGDITPAAGFALAERDFGDWRASAAAPPAVAEPAGAGRLAPRVIVIDLPGAGQAAVSVTREGLARRDPRYYQALVADSILGGGYSGRLNQEVRVKRGLSYGAYASMAFRRAPGPITASTQTKNESAVEVAELMLAELKRLGDAPPAPEELKARQASLIGAFGRRAETTEDMASLVAGLSLYGVDLGDIGRYGGAVAAVTLAEVQAIGHQVFAPDRASVVIAGDAKVFLAALKAKFAHVEVVPAAAIDLDQPSLLKAR